MKDGGPAFPRMSHTNCYGLMLEEQNGMTLRDYFAAKAMQSLIAMRDYEPWPFGLDMSKDDDDTQLGVAVRTAYYIADAMLAERSK